MIRFLLRADKHPDLIQRWARADARHNNWLVGHGLGSHGIGNNPVVAIFAHKLNRILNVLLYKVLVPALSLCTNDNIVNKIRNDRSKCIVAILRDECHSIVLLSLLIFASGNVASDKGVTLGSWDSLARVSVSASVEDAPDVSPLGGDGAFRLGDNGPFLDDINLHLFTGIGISFIVSWLKTVFGIFNFWLSHAERCDCNRVQTANGLQMNGPWKNSYSGTV